MEGKLSDDWLIVSGLGIVAFFIINFIHNINVLMPIKHNQVISNIT